ncbi:sodium:calcium antiporter [Liberiplasma polymorphum]|uniref:sodium:calcium antiporter n=1 Tax=Liberiplasma polymorphum TaxID=3374570 RepID=UPI0037757CD4
MSLPILLLIYTTLAILTILSTQKASFYVNELDKKTKISGALIGGVLLATVTSLPEFITSITSTVVLKEPGLAFGNVFGSNMFNLLILAIADLVFIKHLFFNQTKTGLKTNSLIIMMYAIFLLPLLLSKITNSLGYHSFDIRIGIAFSIISLLIIIVYFFTIKAMNDELPDETVKGTTNLSMKKIVTMFILWGLAVVISSIFITYITDSLALKLNLSASFAGAIFLGVATSLPEFTAVITLFKLRNYEVALGNILGSNIFNMTIISVVDFINVKDNIFEVLSTDPVLWKNISLLLILGFINSIIVMVALKRKPIQNKLIYALPSVMIIIAYVVYIALSL